MNNVLLVTGNFAVGNGYAWFVFPINTMDFKPIPEEFLEEYEVLTSYERNGMVLLTKKEPPLLPTDWTFQKAVLLEGWGAAQDGWKWRVLHQIEDNKYSVAGVWVGH